MINDERWHRLCQEAMREKDVTKLLKIFLELDRSADARKQTEILAQTVREHRSIERNGNGGNGRVLQRE